MNAKERHEAILKEYNQLNNALHDARSAASKLEQIVERKREEVQAAFEASVEEYKKEK
jgi:hypothetical protein